MTDYKMIVKTKTVDEILAIYPVAMDFLANYNLKDLPTNLSLYDALKHVDERFLEEFGLTRERPN